MLVSSALIHSCYLSTFLPRLFCFSIHFFCSYSVSLHFFRSYSVFLFISSAVIPCHFLHTFFPFCSIFLPQLFCVDPNFLHSSSVLLYMSSAVITHCHFLYNNSVQFDISSAFIVLLVIPSAVIPGCQFFRNYSVLFDIFPQLFPVARHFF